MFIRIVKGLREQAKPKNFLLPLLTVLLAKIKVGGEWMVGAEWVS